MIKRDIVSLCILYLLSENDMYGYEVFLKLESVLRNVKESDIYILLRSLFSEDYTECYDAKVSADPMREYYKITNKGREKKAELLYEWQHLCGAFQELGIS